MSRTYTYLAALVGVICGWFLIRLFFFSHARALTLRSDVVQGILIGFGLAFVTAQIYARIKATKVNGWITMFGLGEPGNGMLLRAAHAQLFPGPVNIPQEAMYWWTNVDGAGHTLSGAHDYIMHFPAGGLPPNNAFWSLTMGDCEKSLCAESDQPLQRQRSFRPRAKPRRFGRHLHSEHRSGRSRVQLAARARGPIHPLAARVHTRRGHSRRASIRCRRSSKVQ